MNPDDVQRAADRAAELVKNVQPEFREIAFQELFTRLLDDSVPISGQMPSAKRPIASVNESNRDELLKTLLEAEIDMSSYHDLLEKGSWVDRVLLLLWILENQFGVKALTPPEMAEIFTKKFRKAKVHAPNVSRAITKSEYFLRSPEGNAYKYGLSSKGIERIKALTVNEIW